MKKVLSALLLLIVALLTWFYLYKQVSQKPPISSEPTKAIVESQKHRPETNLVEAHSHAAPNKAVPESTNMIVATATEPINALKATNLEQWKAAISGLKKLGGFTTEQHWLVEQPGRKVGLPILLNLGGKTVQYNAVLISINAEIENERVIRVEMQTPNMNIGETRELGLQLCNMLGFDSADFQAWCDKVGNHWLDAPLYSSKGFRDSISNKMFGFQMLMTYNNEKPWMINFIIGSP